MGASSSISSMPLNNQSNLVRQTWRLIVDENNPSPQFLFMRETETENFLFQTAEEWFISVFYLKFHNKIMVVFE